MKQWEIWKARPPGFQTNHWFVIISAPERIASPRHAHVNGLACFTLRGELLGTDVRLNSADGFTAPTACQCDLAYVLEKSKTHSRTGSVSYERQQAIKRKLIEVLRFVPA